MKKTILFASSFLMLTPAMANDNFILREAGVVAVATPASPGLRIKKLKYRPYVNIHHKSGWFLVARKGVGYHLIDDENKTIDVSINYDFGRKEKDDKQLNNMGDIKGSLTYRIAGTYNMGKYKLTGYIEKLISSHKGLKSQIAIEKNLYADSKNKFFVKGSVYAQYLDKKYSNARYGVTAEQSNKTNYTQFIADSGFDLAGIKLNGYKFLSNGAYLKGTIAFSTLIGSAKNAPMTQQNTYVGALIVLGTNF